MVAAMIMRLQSHFSLLKKGRTQRKIYRTRNEARMRYLITLKVSTILEEIMVLMMGYHPLRLKSSFLRN